MGISTQVLCSWYLHRVLRHLYQAPAGQREGLYLKWWQRQTAYAAATSRGSQGFPRPGQPYFHNQPVQRVHYFIDEGPEAQRAASQDSAQASCFAAPCLPPLDVLGSRTDFLGGFLGDPRQAHTGAWEWGRFQDRKAEGSALPLPLSYFRSWLKCHLLGEAFPEHPGEKRTPTVPVLFFFSSLIFYHVHNFPLILFMLPHP